MVSFLLYLLAEYIDLFDFNQDMDNETMLMAEGYTLNEAMSAIEVCRSLSLI